MACAAALALGVLLSGPAAWADVFSADDQSRVDGEALTGDQPAISDSGGAGLLLYDFTGYDGLGKSSPGGPSRPTPPACP